MPRSPPALRKNVGVGAALAVRTVVAHEQDERVAIDLAFADEVGQAGDVAIHPRDHGRERRVRRRLRAVAERGAVGHRAGRPAIGGRVDERRLGQEAALERRQRIFRRPQLGVRHGVVQVDEERLRVGAGDERLGLAGEEIVDVVAVDDRPARARRCGRGDPCTAGARGDGRGSRTSSRSPSCPAARSCPPSRAPTCR